jgi:hypothetical protein
VPLTDLTSREAVEEALAEFDVLGRDAFLAKYGFGQAGRYFINKDGKHYDAKAVAGAAVGFEHPDRGPMPHTAFSGGEGGANARLRELGFEVVETPPPSEGESVWMVKAGRSDIHVPVLLREGVVAVEWEELPDLSGVPDAGQLERLLVQHFPNRPQSTVTRDRNELFAFVHDMAEGDLVVMPESNGRFALGRCLGPYQLDRYLDLNAAKAIEL